jgi:hypothetical protein
MTWEFFTDDKLCPAPEADMPVTGRFAANTGWL